MADRLPNSADQAISDLLVYESISGKAKTVLKSQFGDEGFTIWGLLSCF